MVLQQQQQQRLLSGLPNCFASSPWAWSASLGFTTALFAMQHRKGSACDPHQVHMLCLCRPNDLRYYAEKYGPVKDVYLPKDYYSG